MMSRYLQDDKMIYMLELNLGGTATLSFREGVTPWLPFRRPRLRLALGSDRAPLLTC